MIDVVGGSRFKQLLEVLRRGGRYAVAGAIAGPVVELDLRTLYLKDLRLLGCTIPDAEVFANLVRYIEGGEIRPLVSATFPLSGDRHRAGELHGEIARRQDRPGALAARPGRPLHKSHLPMQIRTAQPADSRALAEIIVPVFREGSTYTIDPDISEADALAYWLSPDKETFVAEADGTILGTYYLRANQAGGGRHVCNCGYMTRAEATGRGVARAMCLHSLDHARTRGYRAMQFNFVVTTNERAIHLWQSLGFQVVGRLPAAFKHPRDSFVDALVMYQLL